MYFDLSSGPVRKVLSRSVIPTGGPRAQARKGLAQIVDLEGAVPGLRCLPSPVVLRLPRDCHIWRQGAGCEKVLWFFVERLPSWEGW